jgi:capsular polysaccharide transport system ATP-binding protein
MLDLKNVTKYYPVRRGERVVLDDVSLKVQPGEKLGILGRNGAGKSTLIRLLSGVELPDSGSIIRGMSVSWPLAFSGTFQEQLTGLDNMRFVCRIYNKTSEDKIPYVQEFSELGQYFKEPVLNYSSGMRARLAFALSMIVEFDCYLIDEVMSVGDRRFTEKCKRELFEKRRDRSMIIVSHEEDYVRAHCDHLAVLVNGRLHRFQSLDEGYAFYQEHMKL